MKHHLFCSRRASDPCPIHCETWPLCARQMFPNMTGAEDLCNFCHQGPCLETVALSDNQQPEEAHHL